MDDFERAVIISFDLTHSIDPSLKERANTFIFEIKQQPNVWQLCVERFSVTSYSEVKFWCLQTLQEVIRSAYASLEPGARNMIKTALMTWVTRDCNNPQLPLPPFLRNKVAQTLVSVLQHEYPSVWPGFFQDLLRAMLPGSQLAAAGMNGQPSGTLGPVMPGNEGLVDMWCRILVSVDEDLVSLDIPRSQDESKLSMHIKDSMREHSIADIAAAWHVMVTAYTTKAPDLAALLLTTMTRYITWMDIGLAAHSKFVAMLISLLDASSTPPGLRGAAADCLAEMVIKRMDPVPKLALVQNMGIVPHCAAWAAGFPMPTSRLGRGPAPGSQGAAGPGGPDQDSLNEEDLELLLKLARLLSSLAGEIMDALKRVENVVISFNALGVDVSDEATQEAGGAAAQASQLLEQLFPAVLSAFRSEVDEVALPLLPFLSAYMARLKTLQKRNGGLSGAAVAHVHAMLEGLAGCARFPKDSAYSLTGVDASAAVPNSPTRLSVPQAAKDEQSEVDEKRRELFTLFRNLSKTAYNESVMFLGRALQSVIGAGPPGSGQVPWQDVEMALTLLYEVGEAGLEDMSKPDCGALAPLVTALAQSVGRAGGAGGGAGGGPGANNAAGGPGGLNGHAGEGIIALPAARHPLVALTVLELFVRYSKVLQQSQHLLPGVVLAYLDDRGMSHPLEEVSTRACYLFARMSKLLRFNLRPLLGQLLPPLEPILARVMVTPLVDTPGSQAPRDSASKVMAPTNAIVDDRLYVFEAVGLLLGQDEVPVEEQAAALAAMLAPLTRQIRSNLRSAPGGPAAGQAAPGMIVQALEAVMRLSKGFKTDLLTRQRTQLGMMFAGVLEASLVVPREYPAHRVLRSRFISFIHRMVEALQAMLLPYLPSALEALVSWPQADAPDITEVLTLTNQLVCKFKESLAPLLEALLPVVVGRLQTILGQGWDWSGRAASRQTIILAPASAVQAGVPVANGTQGGCQGGAQGGPQGGPGGSTGAITTQVSATLEDAREKGELQRAFYVLLHSIAHNGLSGVLLKQDPGVVLEPVMAALTGGAATHVDPSIRRTCVQVYSRLIQEWVSSGSAEAIPGFKRYAMEHLGGEACVLGLLRSQPPLDPKDGATLALLSDLAHALKLVYERCGEEFCNHLLTVVAPAAGLPPQLAQQLVACIRLSEPRDVRDALRSLLTQIQQASGK